jgi:hypothetical protein
MRLSTSDLALPLALPKWKRHLRIFGGAVLISALVAWPHDLPAEEEHKSCGTNEGPAGSAEVTPDRPATAGPQAAPSLELKSKRLSDGRTPRRLVTFRGEIVDYYCYIEKGATGPAHRDCGVRCVAGDVCMGLLTTDDRLMMISINHMRAMDPLSFKDTPDAFAACRALIAEQVDLTGFFMERKGQRIIEVMDVKRVAKPAAAKAVAAKSSSTAP